MEIASLFVRLLIAALFLSTAWSKLRKGEAQKMIVMEYRIVPERYVPAFIQADVMLQLAVALLFASGVFLPIACLIASGLLFLYSLAIGINLVRGRRAISCGCGGLAGNHQLSWWLVWRNVGLIALCGWLYPVAGTLGSLQALYAGVPIAEAFGWSYLFTLLCAAAAGAAVGSVNKLLGLRRRMEEQFQES